MKYKSDLKSHINQLIDCENLLIVQDLDGVCMPLVKDPLKREIDKNYVKSIAKLENEFAVLTCGEHEGKRGVNRIVERAFNSKNLPKERGFYLPGLAACGIEYQDNFGEVKVLGIKDEEVNFLREVPSIMKEFLYVEIENCLSYLTQEEVAYHTNLAICDTRFSPAINLNGLFSIVGNNLDKKRELQAILHRVMLKIIDLASKKGLKDSFHLHISPNLGIKEGIELIKLATHNDIGTTDIQLIIKGALKEAGLLVLLNKYIENKYGYSPFGKEFNVRNSPRSIIKLIELCKKNISQSKMPVLIGVGDTVTSTIDNNSKEILRGGSDRGFLTLIQELGKQYKKDNLIVFVDSSHGEVNRPTVKNGNFDGITDKEDLLKFNLVMSGGPLEYLKWIIELSNKRQLILKDK